MGVLNKLFGKKQSATTQRVPKGMVAIPAGSFMMGSIENDWAKPVHKVTLDTFYMDTTEVTQADYEALMGVNPGWHRWVDNTNQPVDSVTWFDSVLYCNKRSQRDGFEPVYQFTGTDKRNIKGFAQLDIVQCIGLSNLKIDYSKNGYRLPTEAEWEYACRAGTTTRYYWGDAMDDAFAWAEGNSSRSIQPVGKKKPNAWGLYDMSGNLFEWCNDWFDKNYYASSPEKNPKGPVSGTGNMERVRRGGSTYLGNEKLQSADRSSCARPDSSNIEDVGFRCVVALY